MFLYGWQRTRYVSGVPVSVRSFRKVASGLDTFLEAAAERKHAAAPFASIMKTVFAIAVGSGISLKLAISAGAWTHVDDLLIELKTN